MNFPPTLFSNGGLSLVRILGSASRAIGIFRQVSPIIKDIKPLISKVPKFMERLNAARSNAALFTSSINRSINGNIQNIEKNVPSSKNAGPIFFQ